LLETTDAAYSNLVTHLLLHIKLSASKEKLRFSHKFLNIAPMSHIPMGACDPKRRGQKIADRSKFQQH
jgi:hypothetical protein